MKSPKRLYLSAHVNLEIPVALAVAGGRHAGDGLEHPVEMGQIGKTGLPADLGDVLVGLQEHALGVHDPRHIDVADDGAVGVGLKFPAQVEGAYVKLLRQALQRDGLGVIIMDVMDDAADAFALLCLDGLLHAPLPGQVVEQEI